MIVSGRLREDITGRHAKKADRVEKIDIMIDALIEAFKGRPSERMLELFSATKKNEVVKLCKKMTLSDSDLVSMIIGCGSIGYHHIPEFFETDPAHLWAKFQREQTAGNWAKIFNQLQHESKRTVFHFFVLSENSKIWQLFFYDTTEHSGRSRFIEGAHIHFLNHLWGLDLTSIFERLPERPAVSSHIKTRTEKGRDLKDLRSTQSP